MAEPVRLQLSRRKGFSLQALSMATNGLRAAKVDRSSKFGSPFPIIKGTSTSCGVTSDIWQVGTWNGPAMWFRDSREDAQKLSVEAFSAWIKLPQNSCYLAQAKLALHGRNLACWCSLDRPCHGDVWLELANPDPSQ